MDAGRESDRMINLVDLYATFQEIISGKVMGPDKAAADSFSFYSALKGTGDQDARPTMVQNDVAGMVAIRKGDWKYIEGKELRPGGKDKPKELYNLKADPAESNNLIKQHPEIAEQLQKQLDLIRSKQSERLAAK